MTTLNLVGKKEQIAFIENRYLSKRPYRRIKSKDIEQTVWDCFIKKAQQNATKIAIKTEAYSVTYAELADRAEKLRVTLLHLANGKNGQVALLFSQDVHMITGMLAALGAGQAYVVLDCNTVQERSRYIITDVDPKILITDTEFADLGAELIEKTNKNIHLVNINAIPTPLSVPNLPYSSVTPDTIAYISYTSGTTGKPKGVYQNHRNLLHFWRVFTNAFHINAKDKITSLSNYCFDTAINDIYCALLNGACLYPMDIIQQNAAHYLQWICNEKITIYHSTPTVFRYFMQSLSKKDMLPVRLIWLGGEKATLQDFSYYEAHCSKNCHLVNGLGLTESSVNLQYFISHATRITQATLPAGYPVEETEIFLLDKQGKITQHEGEIVIKSRYLSLGYWNNPSLTAERFIKDKELCLYKTGDLGRYLSTGAIVHLGRLDHQIKIRGIRIEPAEIEAHLRLYPGIKDALVLLQETGREAPRLIAYLISRNKTNPTLKLIRQFLNTKIPEYMIPKAWVIITQFPLLPSGKIDRKALSFPTKNQWRVKSNELAPRTSLEKELIDIQSELLNIRSFSIGILDDFFALGGNSLLAVQFISRIYKRYNIMLSVRQFFSKPTIVALASAIESGKKKQDLQISTQDTDSFLLSFGQQQLWFLNQYIPKSALYSLTYTASLQGALNIHALETALHAVVARQESLRTIFPAVDGQPKPCILKKSEITIHQLDFSEQSDENQKESIQKCLQYEAQEPFNLTDGPLIRVTLISAKLNQYTLILSIHHIISDGWSVRILLREWSHFYDAYILNQPHSLSPLAIRYVDFSAWQHLQFENQLKEHLAYWRTQLKDAPTFLALPTDKLRPAVHHIHGAIEKSFIPLRLTKQLKSFSAQKNVTLFMTLLATFQVLLYRYSNQKDLLVGIPVANRYHEDLEHLIGLFVNTVVIRAQLAHTLPFEDFLTQIRSTILDAYDHASVPFEKIVSDLNIERTLSHAPLIQTMFALQNTSPLKFALKELETIQLEEVYTSTSQFDLSLVVREEMDGLQVIFEYRTDLFESLTIKRMSTHFIQLLKNIITNPTQAVSTLNLLNTAEQTLLMKWNRTEKNYALDKTIHQLFEEQVVRKPNHIALVYQDKSLTYDELNQKANQVAHYLRKLNIIPDTLVAICLDRSLELIITILGVLKAGGAYVPLNPAHPETRLVSLLDNCQPVVLLTTSNHKLTGSKNRSFIRLNIDSELFSTEIITNPSPRASAKHLAYVIYTSGSTGSPKGVAIEHHSVVNFINWAQHYFKLTTADHCSQYSEICFDASIEEIFPTLACGASLHIIDEPMRLNMQDMNNYFEKHAIKRAYLPPVMFELFSTLKNKSLRIVSLGGDKLMRCSQHSYKVYNNYGPTESTVFVTCCAVNPTTLTPSIGTPISNCQIYILNEGLALQPIGVPGEIYISGEGLARSYLNCPELTKEKFIHNLFSKDPDAKLYKTGDIGYWLQNGHIHYCGRTDAQIKIRGFRIELGEIEFCMLNHPHIKEAHVLLYEVSEQKELVAYFVVHSNSKLSIQDLRFFLQKRLPDYMIPNHFFPMDKFPRKLNKKLDKNSFPLPNKSLLEAALENPHDAIEIQLMTIWADILKVDRHHISIDHNFFDLGGYSLLSIQLIFRINEHFKTTYPVSWIFINKTLEMQANSLRDKSILPTYQPVLTFNNEGMLSNMFFIHAGGSGAETYIKYPFFLGKQQPFYAIESYNLHHTHAPLQTIEALASYYIKIIQAIQPQGPYKLGGWCSGGIIAYEIAQQLQQKQQSVEQIYLLDSTLWVHTQQRREDPNSAWNEYKNERLMKNNFYLSVPELYQEKINKALQLEMAALSRYQIKPYHGSVLLFKAAENKLNTDFESLVSHLSTYHCAGDHFSIVKDDQIVSEIATIMVQPKWPQ